jgi:hypothetical protein
MYAVAAVRSHRSLLLTSRIFALALLWLGLVAAPAPAAPLLRGKVVETMDAADYTYVHVATEGGDLWAAGPRTAVKVGDRVDFAPGVAMKNFRSATLDRTFESIQFVDRIAVSDGGSAPGSIVPAPAHGEASGAAPPARQGSPHEGVNPEPPAEVDVSGIVKAANGKTIGEVFDARTVLVGKEVAVRAKVVKSNPGIMGHNWLHLRDGSKSMDGANDLTVTTKDTAGVGATVLVRGTVATSKDFGFGYRYDVMLEDAKVTVE